MGNANQCCLGAWGWYCLRGSDHYTIQFSGYNVLFLIILLLLK